MSTGISAGVDDWPCFTTFYCYDPYWLKNWKFFLTLVKITGGYISGPENQIWMALATFYVKDHLISDNYFLQEMCTSYNVYEKWTSRYMSMP